MKQSYFVPFIVVLVLFLAAASAGVWAFMSRQDYKDHSDQKVVAAVQVAQALTASKKDNEFAAKEKLPLKTYGGPAAYGSLKIKYPKTWSAYVSEDSNNSSTPINAYFNPNFVPGTDVKGVVYALRAQVIGQSYAQVLQSVASQVKSGQTKATVFIPASNKSVTGTRLDGKLLSGATGSMVILPSRDKTIELWTESNTFLNDFNTIILPNFSFSQ